MMMVYPAAYRQEFGAQMTQTFRDLCRETYIQEGTVGLIRRAMFECADVLATAPGQHIDVRRLNTMSELPEAKPPLKRQVWGVVRETVTTIAMAALIFFVVELFTPRYYVEGRSMEPNFDDGQRLIAGRVGVFPGELQRGDVVVLRYATQPKSEPPLIKRLIGLPGETITIQDRVVYVNGEALDEPYIKEPCDQWHCQDREWVLGADEYFFMGDNRNHSNDSRSFGPVNREYVISRVIFRYWPPRDLGVMSGADYSD
jgi:signal peptidase I